MVKLQHSTLRILAQQVIRAYNRGDVSKDTTLDPREVMLRIRQSLSYLMKGQWFDVKKAGINHIPAQFIATFEGVNVEKSDTGTNYSLLPSPCINLPNDLGIFEVLPDNTEVADYGPMIPIPASMHSLYRQLAAGALQGQRSFNIERKKITFNKRNGKTLLEEGIETVTIKELVVAPDEMEESEPLFYPPEMIEDALMRTMEYFGIQESIRRDMINDNQPV